MPGQKLDVCRLPRPGLREVGRQSGRVYPPSILHKMHMQNFTGSAASGHSVAHRLQTRKYLYEKEKANGERETERAREVTLEECVWTVGILTRI